MQIGHKYVTVPKGASDSDKDCVNEITEVS